MWFSLTDKKQKNAKTLWDFSLFDAFKTHLVPTLSNGTFFLLHVHLTPVHFLEEKKRERKVKALKSVGQQKIT